MFEDFMSIQNIVVGSIEYKDKLLLIKRKRGDYQQKYALVGGKLDFDEGIQKAMQREIMEETGLTVTWKGIKAIINEKLKNKKNNSTSKQFLIILCSTEAGSDVVKESDEGELRWFSKEDIDNEKENIIPSDYLMITQLLRRNNMNSIIELDLFEENNDLELGSFSEY
ncbi:NUDIX domain-containing protein [Candidatus Heimdallarchaeota archaeon]|nr:MAG: NUDIX domain-containing protein [Candidatus Heimdallarchaeota archaeon]